MAEALTPLARASPANCVFHASKPAGRASALRGARFVGHAHERHKGCDGDRLKLATLSHRTPFVGNRSFI